MSFPFSAREGLVVVRAELTGPAGKASIRLASDSGATSTLIDVARESADIYAVGAR